jgi:phosphoenolpyruvate carboxylase
VSDPHAPLRQDIRLLGDLLGERLRTSDGDALFAIVERVRALSKDAHGARGDAAFDELSSLLGSMPIDRALPVARAFAQFLSLANIAEQHHRIRRRRDYLRDPSAGPQRGSFDETFARLIAAGVAPERLHTLVSNMAVDLVFTAHPTEIARRTSIQINTRIAELLEEEDRPDLTAPEREAVVDALRREVAISWGTDEVRAQRPTPLDEVRWGLAVFEQTLWKAVPATLGALDRALQAHTGRGLPADARPLRFSSWIGGDRDGNPEVTPDVTRRATLMARWVAADLFLRDVGALLAEISLESGTSELHERAGVRAEPYRAVLRDVRARLLETKGRLESALESGAPRIDEPITAAGLRDALALCHRSLAATGNEVIAGGRLLDVMRRADVFGLALTPLDIRQEAEKHTAAIDALAGGEYARRDERGRQRWLLERLDAGGTSGDGPGAGAAADVLETCRMAALLHRESLGAYVITMASAPSDVLAVEYLQQWAGIEPRMRVVPLFETARDLASAGQTLRDLLEIPWYRQRVEAHHGRQEVMVGYSDSSKDAGRFAAAWDLYRAQEEIVAACRDRHVKLTLFHGRGGSVGRGGGPTYLAIQSQPPGSIDGTLRVTEQGEMIQAKFGLPGIAARTLEVYVTATAEAALVSRPGLPAEFCEEMDRLAHRSREAFRAIVHGDSAGSFLDYFRAATPERELELTNIGSRPARRGAATGDVKSLRAIPWQFAWTQTRLLLASWLGVEAALQAGADEPALARWRRMYREWPFFRSTVDLIEMVLAKSDARIAGEYDRRLVPPELRPIGVDLRARLDRAIAAILAVSGHRELLEDNPVLRRSIDVRNPYVDPINLVQIELLKRLRAEDPGTSGETDLRQAFVVTVNGIAAGMRNTG